MCEGRPPPGGPLRRGTVEDGGRLAGGAHETPADLIAELRRQGVKHPPEASVRIERMPDGRIVFLEQGKGGDKGSGLAHILERHAADFANRGISQDEIPDLIMTALRENNIVGYVSETRPIYKVVFNGHVHYVAITVGDNGFVVGASPAPRRKIPK
jgi:hypothetical protein